MDLLESVTQWYSELENRQKLAIAVVIVVSLAGIIGVFVHLNDEDEEVQFATVELDQTTMDNGDSAIHLSYTNEGTEDIEYVEISVNEEEVEQARMHTVGDEVTIPFYTPQDRLVVKAIFEDGNGGGQIIYDDPYNNRWS